MISCDIYKDNRSKFLLDQAYMLVAFHQQKYVDFALHSARSIKLWDKRRPIHLVVNNADLIQNIDQSPFDCITLVRGAEDFPGCLSKLLSFQCALFPENLFVDADCVMVKSDIDYYWERLAAFDFTIPGDKKTKGEWNSTRIEDIIAKAGVDYMVKMNSGVIYFKKNAKAEQVFARAFEFLELFKQGSTFSETGENPFLHHGVIADEPLFGLSMAKEHCEPFPVVSERMKSLMISTLGGSSYHVDLAKGEFQFKKGTVDVSPTLAHFVGIEPKDLYDELCQAVERAYSALMMS
ncbi:hypothetical protein [Desulfovibrio inopinatus]|uniref:hypothetical protein n=1 Tax=Desulfovibrio inopinatus TaxID=102109 RepID=UPI000402A6A4|nr:hypothetical protein [Desulfovibrio inopinatus]